MQLIASQVNFEKAVEDAIAKHDLFLSVVHKREQFLDSLFHKCFASGPNLPPALHDFTSSLIDCYKSTVLAFQKFAVRQR